jgi:hypothetical protein
MGRRYGKAKKKQLQARTQQRVNDLLANPVEMEKQGYYVDPKNPLRIRRVQKTQVEMS